jgi:hypothetical protein
VRVQDPNLERIELVATALGPLRDEVFTRIGFKRDRTSDAPICRWRYRGIAVDLMPTDPNVLGFANRWYGLAMETAQRVSLPSGTAIRLISAPTFIATKFEAFADRGQGDLLASHDLEDIVNVIASRTQILEEIAGRSAKSQPPTSRCSRPRTARR